MSTIGWSSIRLGIRSSYRGPGTVINQRVLDHKILLFDSWYEVADQINYSHSRESTLVPREAKHSLRDTAADASPLARVPIHCNTGYLLHVLGLRSLQSSVGHSTLSAYLLRVNPLLL